MHHRDPPDMKPTGMLPRRTRTKVARTVNLHDEVDVTIDSLSNSGDGVARVDGRVLFVPRTAPGDKARVHIRAAKKQWLKARLVEVLEPGPDRVDAPCELFDECGGCDWQHVDYAAQLRTKREQLVETLVRIGELETPEVQPVIAADPPWHYRNRVQGEAREGRLHLHRRLSGEPVAVPRCLIADERINARLAEGLPAGLQGRVELALEGDEVVVRAAGERDQERGFTQVNDAMGERLMALVLGAVADSDAPRVMDLYCGAGAWTVRIAQAHPDKHVLGIELDAGSVQIARQRGRDAGLKNLAFQNGRVESHIAALDPADSVCIVDPPRAGLDAAVVQRLRERPAGTLVYVSCHPATLARDLKALGRRYTVQRIQPLDMFAQTSHLEVCVTLRASVATGDAVSEEPAEA